MQKNDAGKELDGGKNHAVLRVQTSNRFQNDGGGIYQNQHDQKDIGDSADEIAPYGAFQYFE